MCNDAEYYVAQVLARVKYDMPIEEIIALACQVERISGLRMIKEGAVITETAVTGLSEARAGEIYTEAFKEVFKETYK